MSLISREFLQKLPGAMIKSAVDPARLADRMRFMERNVGLPTKAAVLGIISYYLFFSNWFEGLNSIGQVALEPVRGFVLAYLMINVGVTGVILFMDRLPLSLVKWVTAMNSLTDGLFLAAMLVITGGFDSPIYWVFIGLIVRNAVSIPVAMPQFILNLSVIGSYTVAGLLYGYIIELQPLSPETYYTVQPGLSADGSRASVSNAPVGGRSSLERRSRAEENMIKEMPNPFADDATHSAGGALNTAQTRQLFLARIFILLFMTVCCYGVEVLLDKQRETQEETQEFAVRQGQLRTTGRFAAEMAHQLKNPLAIINNASFTLQRMIKGEKKDAAQQIDIIREEVGRCDRIITELMGYAQLSEGRVEKLDMLEEVNRAITHVFPTGAKYETKVVVAHDSELPAILMQKAHLREVLVNVLLNAREALQGKGRIDVAVRRGPGETVIVTITDNGPGIAEYHLDQIFEPYFSMKEKGTGLGLAIVKHNTEIYGGTVRVESELGKRTCFKLEFPAKVLASTSK